MNTQFIVEPIQSDSLVPDYIFYKFDSLLPGNGFIIHEDNDPHTLYDQLLKEKGDSFSWEYLEVGPKKWCIKISKRDTDDKRETLGEMAVSDHRKALILRKYGLDFSFKGKRTLREACMEKNISTRNIERDLNASGLQSLVYTVNYNSWELDYLVDFINANHHEYTRKVMLCISDEFDRYEKIIRQNHIYLIPLLDVFNRLHTSMNEIMLQEEQILFPYIRFLVQAQKGKVGNALPSGLVLDHINKLESAHQKLGEQLEYICEFTNNYTMPHIEHSFYDKILQWLNEFDSDLHQHIHVENNILFPKAIKLEQDYLSKARPDNFSPEKLNATTDHLSALL